MIERLRRFLLPGRLARRPGVTPANAPRPVSAQRRPGEIERRIESARRRLKAQIPPRPED